jgi:nucleotidyltransferase/DNA polymerase involved in DNA repair
MAGPNSRKNKNLGPRENGVTRDSEGFALTLADYVAEAADRHGLTIDQVLGMSMEEIELMKEARIRNNAEAQSTLFDALIAFLMTALPDNKEAFQKGKAQAAKIHNMIRRRSVYGLKKTGDITNGNSKS